MVEGQDLDELPTERPIEEGIGPGALHSERLAGEFDRFVMLDRQVVVVDAVGREPELGRLHAAIRAVQGRLARARRGRLLADDVHHALRRRLDRALVDVAGDPASP